VEPVTASSDCLRIHADSQQYIAHKPPGASKNGSTNIMHLSDWLITWSAKCVSRAKQHNLEQEFAYSKNLHAF